MPATAAALQAGSSISSFRRINTTSFPRLTSQASQDPDDNAKDFTDTLPPDSLWLKNGSLRKKVLITTVTWQPRDVVLTEQMLCFAKPGSLSLLDSIPLHEIKEVFEGNFENREVGNKRFSMKSAKSQEVEKAGEDTNAFEFTIATLDGGYNSGRSFTLSSDTEKDRSDWVSQLQTLAKEACKRVKAEEEAEAKKNKWRYIRKRVRKVHASRTNQTLVALVIMASYATELYGSEVLPEKGTTAHNVLYILDCIYTTIFALDVSINLFANWFSKFWKDGWNVFDVIIVSISVVSVFVDSIPALSLLRLLRIFRVVRLFRALRSLQRIIAALMASLFPVASSFLVLMVVTTIYSVLATRLFREYSDVFFGSFSKSLFTMFQMCTGDSWASSVVRSIFESRGQINHWIAFFFLSYVIIAYVILINIVIAVLLDVFITSVSNDKKATEEQRQIERDLHAKYRTALDPLLADLAQFGTSEELTQRVQTLYSTLDEDESDSLDFNELNVGLRRLKYSPSIHLSPEDFTLVTDGEAMCDEHGGLNRDGFERMIRKQLKLYAQHQTANAMNDAEERFPLTVLFAFKILTMTIDENFQPPPHPARTPSDPQADKQLPVPPLALVGPGPDPDGASDRTPSAGSRLEPLRERDHGSVLGEPAACVPSSRQTTAASANPAGAGAGAGVFAGRAEGGEGLEGLRAHMDGRFEALSAEIRDMSSRLTLQMDLLMRSRLPASETGPGDLSREHTEDLLVRSRRRHDGVQVAQSFQPQQADPSRHQQNHQHDTGPQQHQHETLNHQQVDAQTQLQEQKPEGLLPAPLVQSEEPVFRAARDFQVDRVWDHPRLPPPLATGPRYPATDPGWGRQGGGPGEGQGALLPAQTRDRPGPGAEGRGAEEKGAGVAGPGGVQHAVQTEQLAARESWQSTEVARDRVESVSGLGASAQPVALGLEGGNLKPASVTVGNGGATLFSELVMMPYSADGQRPAAFTQPGNGGPRASGVGDGSLNHGDRLPSRAKVESRLPLAGPLAEQTWTRDRRGINQDGGSLRRQERDFSEQKRWGEGYTEEVMVVHSQRSPAELNGAGGREGLGQGPGRLGEA